MCRTQHQYHEHGRQSISRIEFKAKFTPRNEKHAKILRQDWASNLFTLCIGEHQMNKRKGLNLFISSNIATRGFTHRYGFQLCEINNVAKC